MRRLGRRTLDALTLLSLLLCVAAVAVHGSELGVTRVWEKQWGHLFDGIVLSRSPGRHIFDDLFPCFLGVFATLPVWRCYRLIQHAVTYHGVHRRRLGNLCPVCGYDLRATPDRCPECGVVPAARASA